MPHLNPDEAANDEPKSYNDEAIGVDDGWQDSKDLNDIKGDLVDEDDGDPIPPLYDNKANARRNGDAARRGKEEVEGERKKDMGGAAPNFPYPQPDIGSIVPGLNHPLFPNGFLPSSSQVPYSPYMSPYMGSLFRAGSAAERDGNQNSPRGAQPDIPQMYPLPGQLGQIPNPLAPWSPGPLYPLCTASAMAGMLHYPYPFHSFASTSGAVPPFPLVHPNANGIHPNLLHHRGLGLPGMMNGQHNGRKASLDRKSSNPEVIPAKRSKAEKPNRPYVKKPLNAFMIYMKEQRAKVVAECTLKESAAINQILGRKWHSLNRDEQQKYYDMARKERQLHMQLFPGWSARDNYGKRKKRKKEKTPDCTAQNPKKCRAVFGLDQQQSWCAPCRRKKKCIRYQQDGEDSDCSDDSPESYEESQNQLSAFDSSLETSLPHLSSTIVAGSNEGPNPSQGANPHHSADQPPTSDHIKREKFPPAPVDAKLSSNNKHVDSASSSSKFGSSADQTSNYTGGESSASSISSDGKQRHVNNTENNLHRTARCNGRGHREDFRSPPGNMNDLSPVSNSDSDVRSRQLNASHSEASLDNSSSRNNVYTSPLLSPTSLGLHSTSNPFLSPNFSYLASAASLANSPPLVNFMGFPGLKGLPSPIGAGLTRGNSSIPTGNHHGQSASRVATSVLEGKS